MIPYRRAALVSRGEPYRRRHADPRRGVAPLPKAQLVAARSEMTVALAYAVPMAIILWLAIVGLISILFRG